jgi:cation diffusion facilitator family transporter
MTETPPRPAPSAETSAAEEAKREKFSAAASSVAAAVFLTGLKIAVGLATGSLGILAEAAHSGLDLVAAVLTLIAVRLSSRPADPTHTYGHGKVENLSAMFETALLLLTCAWIVFEAVRRLFFHDVEVEASAWAFGVMAVSIVVDASRSRVLRRAARKHHSQALEADALHFSTDIWSSSVVIVGLAFVGIAKAAGLPWLAKADAVAALGVSAIVVAVSIRLGKKTIVDLLDGVPAKMREEVVQAAHVPGVLEVRRARIRRSGPELFIDIVLIVSRHEAFEHAHEISNLAKASIRRSLNVPSADVTVHVAPSREEAGDLATEVRHLAARHGLAVHDVRVYEAEGRPALDFHLEIKDAADVAEAHARATAFEDALRALLPAVGRVVTHLESVKGEAGTGASPPADRTGERIRGLVAKLAPTMGVFCDPHEILVEDIGGELTVSFHCTVEGTTALGDAHALSDRFEHALKAGVPRLARVLIHIEPPETT